MKTKRLLLALSCLLLLPTTGYAQPAQMSGMMRSLTSTSVTSNEDGTRIVDGWIVTKNHGNEVIVWGSGFDEILGLTPEQTEELHEIVEQMRPAFSPEERAALSSRTAWLSIREMQTKLNQVLEPEQRLLLAEISFQAAGGLDSHFLNDQLLDVVNLTDAQKEQMRRINAEFEAEDMASRQQRGEGPPTFDWLNATQEQRDEYSLAQIAIQRAHRESDEARIKQFAERTIAVLTPEQRERAERLTAEAPALVGRFMFRGQGASGAVHPDRGQQGQNVQVPRVPVYVPHAGSWRPGDPIPEEYRQQRNLDRRFPRPANQ